MPRNIGTGIYTIPPDTEGIPDQTIESVPYNFYIHDVETDLNNPRPIIAGGTGANDAEEALFNLGGEKSAQLVDNYDSWVWVPGSFRSAAGATNAPVGGHAFAGIVYINEPLTNPPTNANVTVSARDMNDTVVPSRVYVREKKANVWGPWTVTDATTLAYVAATYAPINSPVFTGDARAPTPAAGDNDTTIATTAFVNATVVSGGAPIPTSNILPVGTFALLTLKTGQTVAADATISGINLSQPIWMGDATSGYIVQGTISGPQQAGTWKNISGLTIGVGSSVGTGNFVGYFIRTA